MARLMLVVLFGAVVAGVAIGVVASVGRAADAGRARLAAVGVGNGAMQKTGFILLVALILYASLWGGA